MEERLSTSSDEKWHDSIAQPKGPGRSSTASWKTFDAGSSYWEDFRTSSHVVSEHLELDQWDGISIRTIECDYIESLIAKDTTGARQVFERFLPRRDAYCFAKCVIFV